MKRLRIGEFFFSSVLQDPIQKSIQLNFEIWLLTSTLKSNSDIQTSKNIIKKYIKNRYTHSRVFGGQNLVLFHEIWTGHNIIKVLYLYESYVCAQIKLFKLNELLKQEIFFSIQYSFLITTLLAKVFMICLYWIIRLIKWYVTLKLETYLTLNIFTLFFS